MSRYHEEHIYTHITRPPNAPSAELKPLILPYSTMEENLPAYKSALDDSKIPNDSSLLPKYSPPSQFTIGAHRTQEPLVGIPEIKGHLALLNAFHELKMSVESPSFVAVGNGIPGDKDKRWGWFVGLAVER